MKFAIEYISTSPADSGRPFMLSYAPDTARDAASVGRELVRDGVASKFEVKPLPDSVLTRHAQYFEGVTVGIGYEACFVLCRVHLKEHFRWGYPLRGIRGVYRSLKGCDSCHGDGPFIP